MKSQINISRKQIKSATKDEKYLQHSESFFSAQGAEDINHLCPNCLSEKICPLAKVWDELRHNIYFQGTHRFFVKGMCSSFSADKLAPPQNKKISWLLLLVISFLLVYPVGSYLNIPFLANLNLKTLLTSFAIVFIATLLVVEFYNLLIYPKRLKNWRKLWYCSTCDIIFVKS
ncbi:hypothetical protein ACF3DV_03600 [Chlorogloeopsis fritschii PCC 9212]|uniref:hypothetical protein n=1 Tax=Chlorogloeopsis fritschii TaxID=1124 RepID=UPI00030FFF9A|nr:hypothetical protein [Chlorogloeopsis fritschii]